MKKTTKLIETPLTDNTLKTIKSLIDTLLERGDGHILIMLEEEILRIEENSINNEEYYEDLKKAHKNLSRYLESL